jgi:acylpyruvate hydrolase
VRLATIEDRNDTVAAVGVTGGYAVLDYPDVGDLLRADGGLASARAARERDAVDVPEASARLTRPIVDPRKVLCVGLNYLDHIEEMRRDRPIHPTLFAKHADTLTGPAADITLPAASSKVDWEAELVVVIGRPLFHADARDAATAIAGYTIANDVSMRDWQSRTLEWHQGKNFDRSCPVGPVMITPDEFDPSQPHAISGRIDGREVQTSTTDQLLFTPPELLAYISTFTRLEPGDLVLTGTPGGTGVSLQPQRFLRVGETLETEIAGIGRLVNRMVPEGPRSTNGEHAHVSRTE